METVAVIYGSFKPCHLGHWKLIEQASKNNDQVILYVSLTDRIKSNEIPVYGEDMEIIWKKHLMELLPRNVKAIFLKGESPIRKIYALLGEAQESQGTEKYIIYSDPFDIVKNFPEQSINKYFKDLMGDGRLAFKSIPREQTVNISGTQMREFLELGNKDDFCKHLPPVKNKDDIWNLLRAKAKKNLLKNTISWKF